MSDILDEDDFSDIYGGEANEKSPSPAPARAPKAPTPQTEGVTAKPVSSSQADENASLDPESGLPPAAEDAPVSHGISQSKSFTSTPPAVTSVPEEPLPPAPTGIKEDGKMFIGGLNWETTDKSLHDYFSQFGDVLECTVMRDGGTGRSRGFGFLTFKDPKTVNIVMVKEHYLDGKIIDPKRAIPREEQEKTSKIFVGGVSQEANEHDFKSFFAQFGRVIDATLMIDKDTGRPRGFGFVTFDSEDAVDACLANPLAILGKPIEVKRAEPRNMRDEKGKFGPGMAGNKPGFQRHDGGFDGQNGQAGQAGPMGMQNPAGMTPAMMAQYWQKMQQYFMMMQGQMMAAQGQRGMVQQQMMMQQQMANMQGQFPGMMGPNAGPNPTGPGGSMDQNTRTPSENRPDGQNRGNSMSRNDSAGGSGSTTGTNPGSAAQGGDGESSQRGSSSTPIPVMTTPTTGSRPGSDTRSMDPRQQQQQQGFNNQQGFQHGGGRFQNFNRRGGGNFGPHQHHPHGNFNQQQQNWGNPSGQQFDPSDHQQQQQQHQQHQQRMGGHHQQAMMRQQMQFQNQMFQHHQHQQNHQQQMGRHNQGGPGSGPGSASGSVSGQAQSQAGNSPQTTNTGPNGRNQSQPMVPPGAPTGPKGARGGGGGGGGGGMYRGGGRGGHRGFHQHPYARGPQ